MLDWLIQFILQWYIWLPILIILVFLTWRNYKKAQTIDSYDYVLLSLDLPLHNSRSEISAEQMFTALHNILRDKHELRSSHGLQEYLSFEMANIEGQVRLFVRAPKHLQNFVETQIMAQYPEVKIHVAEDYTRNNNFPASSMAELVLNDVPYLPTKTYDASELDMLSAITAAMTRSSNNESRLQILVRPMNDSWHDSAAQFIKKLKSGVGKKKVDVLWYIEALGALWKPPVPTDIKAKELTEREKIRIAGAEKKALKLGYKVKIRIVGLGADQETARSQVQAIATAFKQFSLVDLNGFKLLGKPSSSPEDLQKFAARYFAEHDGFILNVEELATIWHLPIGSVKETNVATADPEEIVKNDIQLPVLTGDPEHDSKISAFGLTNIDGVDWQFGLYRTDRSRHIYAVGQTGTGKTGLLELLALSDIYHNHGYAIIDPHGDFATNNLRFVPPNRIQDVVYFNPADTEFPLGFNPMEVYDSSQRSNVSSEIIGVLKRMFGQSWGPRLEYILRYTILALLEYPNTTMLDITRMLTDKKFRDKVLKHVTDIVVKQFWRVEFGSWGEKETNLAIAPILNKVGAFVANPIIRNIIGQPKSTFNVRDIMDKGKILVINLSKGLIGEDNSAILGSLLITKIQLAAMSRSDIPNVTDRRSFYLYVDEFQNFATDSFAVILSEARKYGLNLAVANQYTSQMSDSMRNAIFGNVGTIISMRVSPEDASHLAPQFAPYFEITDILQMSNRQFITRMVVDEQIIPAVKGSTLKLPPAQTDYLPHIIENTHINFAKPRKEVEQMITNSMSLRVNSPHANLQPNKVGSRALNNILARAAAVKSSNSPAESENMVKRTRTRGRGGNRKTETETPNLPPPPTFTIQR